MKNSRTRIIGLTGGIGSGKSTVSSYLIKKGHAVLDADKVAREIVEPGSWILKELESLFGGEILNADGSLNRKKLAGVIFNDEVLKNKVNALTHGEILHIMGTRIDNLIESGFKGIKFLDIPLLFEVNTGFEDRMDAIWAIDADDETRIRRAVSRGGVSKNDVLSIMKNQVSREERFKRADIVINNSGGVDELHSKLDELIKKYEQ